MCFVPLERVCLLCKFGAFSEIPGIKVSKFSRGSCLRTPLEIARDYCARANTARAFGARSAKLHTKTLIDYIITNTPTQVSHCDVLPCPLISDHDAPYACINARFTRFVPRYKYIRNKRDFDENAFLAVFDGLPLSLVYSVDDPEMQVDILSSLIRECLDRHAPLRRTKVTRPPAPWMKDHDIQELQQQCQNLRTKARRDIIWNAYRDKRNQLKSQTGKTKREFYNKALSSKKPKEVWKTIHRVLQPNPQPLRSDPDELNAHFASTAVHVTGASPESRENLWNLIESLPDDKPGAFSLNTVSRL